MKFDLTKADTGRMIDYWLGGSHNFGVDRVAADRVAAFTPNAPDWVRAQRAFQQQAVRYMAETAGIDHFLVAGAGLPTCGNVHEVATNARVVYTDINPVTIAYGQNILGGDQRVRYVHSDATRIPDIDLKLLNGSVRKGEKDADQDASVGRIGVIFIGIAYFFSDLVLRQTIRALYDWVGEGSLLAVSFIGRDAEQHAAGSLKAYDQMGNHIFTRDPDAIRAVLDPWQPTEHGVAPAPAWGKPAVDGDAGPVFVYGVLGEKPVS